MGRREGERREQKGRDKIEERLGGDKTGNFLGYSLYGKESIRV